MSNIRRIMVLMMVAAVCALGTMGCKSGGKSDHPQGEHPKGEYPDKKTEKPKGDHPKH